MRSAENPLGHTTDKQRGGGGVIIVLKNVMFSGFFLFSN